MQSEGEVGGKMQANEKMKGILAIKEELRRVQIRIEDKIRLIDQAKAYQRPPEINIREAIPNPTSEKLETSKEKPS